MSPQSPGGPDRANGGGLGRDGERSRDPRPPRPEPSVLEHVKWSFVMVLATLAVAALSIWLLRLAGCQNELSRG
ncbi:MAG TPA: hypothetical protein VMS76_15035 [Planctomycetota bacterium]|nr:hypothetical protein [Planctomycetota bacterium]